MSAAAKTPHLAFEPPDKSDTALRNTIIAGLRAHNAALFATSPPGQDMAIALRDPESGEAVGGLLARTAGGWLAVELLFVPENLRGAGLATKMIAMAEDEARRRGCHSAWIDTLNPKAVVLYERLGYVRFGELPDYPAGNSRLFLKKKL